MNIFKTILLLLLPLTSMAENWNKWTLYPSYSELEQVMPAGDDIYAVALGSLYSYNVKDASLQTYTRMTGLSGNRACKLEWVKSTQTLVVAYDDSNLDLLTRNGNVYTISDLADKQMTADKTINSLYAYGQYVFVCTGFGILKVDTRERFVAESYNLNASVKDVFVKNNDIYALTAEGIVLKGEHSRNLYDSKQWQADATPWSELKPDMNAKGRYGTLFHDATNRCYWGADEEGRLTRYEKEGDAFVAKSTGVAPDGPKGNDVWRVYVHDGNVFATAGNFSYGVPAEATLRHGLVNRLDGDGNWHTLDAPSADITSRYVVANCMVFDPRDTKHYWVGSRSGLFEYRDGRCVNHYNQNNSVLSPLYDTSPQDALITSMAYDAAGNLWILNGWTSKPLVCYDNKGQWHNFQHSEFSFDSHTTIDLQGAYVSRTNGLLWFTNTYWDMPRIYRYDMQSDHLTSFATFINEDGQTITPNVIYNVTEDAKGNIWAASDVGPFYISREEANSSNPVFIQHKVPRNDGTNYADYLLAGIPIRTIAVDAANRKWLGTAGNGLYLINSDCNTQLQHFDMNNSPLPSNGIFDITIDHKTGRVYIATDKGLCSYKADVTEDNGGEMDENSVVAYPNPVTPDYTGMISISGLSEHAQLRIMTASGQLVHQGVCYGGTYEWDGCDTQGRRVASGVYMVGVTDENGDKGVLTKVAIVR